MSATAWIQDFQSLAASRERMTAHGPRLVAGVLVALIAIQAAVLITRQPAGTALPSGDAGGASSMPPAALSKSIDLAAIVNAHLFGQMNAKVLSAADAPQTAMPLILAGVYAVNDPEKGMAIIGQTATNARLVQVGSMVPGGARLHAVYNDRVVIDRGGALEALHLPRTLSSSAPPPAASLAPTVSGGQRLQALSQNGTLLNGLLRVQAVTAQGKLMGFRVFPGGRNSMAVFSQLGLRAGDLITNINGTALDDINRSTEVLQTLSNASSASVTVTRNGQPQEINLNFTAVANAAEEAIAADTAAAAENPAAAPGAGRGFGAGIGPGGRNTGRAGARNGSN